MDLCYESTDGFLYSALCAAINKGADVDFHAVMSVTEIEILIGQTERTSRAESPTHSRRNLSTN